MDCQARGTKVRIIHHCERSTHQDNSCESNQVNVGGYSQKTTERRQKDEFVVLEKTSPPVHFTSDKPDQKALACQGPRKCATLL